MMSQSNLILKYAPEPRFLENGLFRFTQPEGLNDPDEARPELSFNKYAPEDYVHARREAERNGLYSISDDELEALFMEPFPADRFDEKNNPGLLPMTERRLRPEPFHTIAELDQCLAERAVELCMQHANRTFGILSLTDTSSEHMWSHYAANHTGVAIRFDRGHPFFVGRISQVEYSELPLCVSINSGWIRIGGMRLSVDDVLDARVAEVPIELLLRKRLSWQHEKEWRLIDRLVNANQRAGQDAEGYAVYLFEIPPDAIDSIVFGYRAKDQAVADALDRIRVHSRWNGIQILRRRLTNLGVVEDRIQ